MLPVPLRVLRTLMGLQLYRLIGLSLLQFTAMLPSFFVIPVVTGDVLTAVFAPVLAIAVSRKRGPRLWAAAIVWNVLGLVDLFYALTLAMLSSAGGFILANDQVVVVGAIYGIALHIICIALLLRRDTVSYFLKPI